MKHFTPGVCAALLLAGTSLAQTGTQFTPAVREFVKEDAPVVALKNVRVIDGTSAAPRENQTIVFAEGKITALGDAATTALPPGAKVLELAGYTVIPGLVGMHNHMYYPPERTAGHVPGACHQFSAAVPSRGGDHHPHHGQR